MRSRVIPQPWIMKLGRSGIRAVLVEPMYTKTKIAKNEKSVQAAIPAYVDQKQRVTEIVEQETANGDDPYDVAEVVYKAANAKVTPPSLPRR